MAEAPPSSPPPDDEDPQVRRLRHLARHQYPLGEIAKRMGISVDVARMMCDTRKIRVVRDNRTGGPRVQLNKGLAQQNFARGLQSGFVARQAHQARLAKAQPLSPQEQREAIERHLRDKGVTKCPTVHLEVSTAFEIPFAGRKRGRG